MSKAFDNLMKKAFNEDINVTRSQADSYFKAISKHFGGDGSYKAIRKGIVSVSTGQKRDILLYLEETKNPDSLIITAVEVGGEKEEISSEINSIKDVPALGSQIDRLFGKIKNKKTKYKPKNRDELKKLVADTSIPLGNIDVSEISDFSGIFLGSNRTNDQFSGIETWDVSKGNKFLYMFQNAVHFNRNLNNWRIVKFSSCQEMFAGCTSFNQPLNKWAASALTSTVNMFKGAKSFNQDLSMWDLHNSEDTTGMFDGTAMSEENKPYIPPVNSASIYVESKEAAKMGIEEAILNTVQEELNLEYFENKLGYGYKINLMPVSPIPVGTSVILEFSKNQYLLRTYMSNKSGKVKEQFKIPESYQNDLVGFLSDLLSKLYHLEESYNKSPKGITMSNTIFGKMLERAGMDFILESDGSVEIKDYKTGWSQDSFGASRGAMKGSVDAIVDGKYRVWADLALNKSGKVKSAREYFNSRVEDMETKQTVNDTALIRKLIAKIVKVLKSKE